MHKLMAKNNNMKWLKILITLGCLLFAVAIAYATLKIEVKHNKTAIVEHEQKIAIVEKATIEQRADIKYIKESVKRIEDKLP